MKQQEIKSWTSNQMPIYKLQIYRVTHFKTNLKISSLKMSYFLDWCLEWHALWQFEWIINYYLRKSFVNSLALRPSAKTRAPKRCFNIAPKLGCPYIHEALHHSGTPVWVILGFSFWCSDPARIVWTGGISSKKQKKKIWIKKWEGKL